VAFQLPHAAGQIISYLEMCHSWSVSFQRGMHFHLRPNISVVLMSRRPNAPYRDRVEAEGRVLIYEGHDVPKMKGTADPKSVDQPRTTPAGRLTQNGLFEKAAKRSKSGDGPAEVVAVYEKIHAGIWAFNGFFWLTDSWKESDGKRDLFKFRLELADDLELERAPADTLPNPRLIPSEVKQEVWRRDGGRCVLCGATDNLHFDHEIPFSKGGSSLLAANVRLLCAKHNLMKRDKIE
jgi:HNH endonuclease